MTSANATLLDAFNAAFNRHDVEGMMALFSADCVFENTAPTPDGTRYTGQAAVRAFWLAFFAASPHAHIEIEEQVMLDDRGMQRWVYSWVDTAGRAGHVRGVDVFRFHRGKIAEKLSYVKG